jgi:CheY-like chemotaxis protein
MTVHGNWTSTADARDKTITTKLSEGVREVSRSGEVSPQLAFAKARKVRERFTVPLVRISMSKLSGAYVLVVEDEVFIALELQILLEDAGARVRVEPDLDGGLNAAENGLDIAVLDVRLRGVDVFPIADRLAERGKPFVFHSGHADTKALEEKYDGAIALSKPARPGEVIDAVAELLGR